MHFFSHLLANFLEDMFLLWPVSDACKLLMSFKVSGVSCLSPWIKQNFPAPLKVEQTLSHR